MHAAIFSAYLDGGFLLAATARIYCSAGSGVFMLLDIAMPALAGGATLSTLDIDDGSRPCMYDGDG